MSLKKSFVTVKEFKDSGLPNFNDNNIADSEIENWLFKGCKIVNYAVYNLILRLDVFGLDPKATPDSMKDNLKEATIELVNYWMGGDYLGDEQKRNKTFNNGIATFQAEANKYDSLKDALPFIVRMPLQNCGIELYLDDADASLLIDANEYIKRGDFDTDIIKNKSTVDGEFLTEALNWLKDNGGGSGGASNFEDLENDTTVVADNGREVIEKLDSEIEINNSNITINEHRLDRYDKKITLVDTEMTLHSGDKNTPDDGSFIHMEKGKVSIGNDNVEILRVTDNGTTPEIQADAPITMNNNAISGLKTPTSDDDAATKQYVDDNAASNGLSQFNDSLNNRNLAMQNKVSNIGENLKEGPSLLFRSYQYATLPIQSVQIDNNENVIQVPSSSSGWSSGYSLNPQKIATYVFKHLFFYKLNPFFTDKKKFRITVKLTGKDGTDYVLPYEYDLSDIDNKDIQEKTFSNFTKLFADLNPSNNAYLYQMTIQGLEGSRGTLLVETESSGTFDPAIPQASHFEFLEMIPKNDKLVLDKNVHFNDPNDYTSLGYELPKLPDGSLNDTLVPLLQYAITYVPFIKNVNKVLEIGESPTGEITKVEADFGDKLTLSKTSPIENVASGGKNDTNVATIGDVKNIAHTENPLIDKNLLANGTSKVVDIPFVINPDGTVDDIELPLETPKVDYISGKTYLDVNKLRIEYQVQWNTGAKKSVNAIYSMIMTKDVNGDWLPASPEVLISLPIMPGFPNNERALIPEGRIKTSAGHPYKFEINFLGGTDCSDYANHKLFISVNQIYYIEAETSGGGGAVTPELDKRIDYSVDGQTKIFSGDKNNPNVGSYINLEDDKIDWILNGAVAASVYANSVALGRELHLNNNKIRNVGEPANNQDVATKFYVDNTITPTATIQNNPIQTFISTDSSATSSNVEKTISKWNETIDDLEKVNHFTLDSNVRFKPTQELVDLVNASDNGLNYRFTMKSGGWLSRKSGQRFALKGSLAGNTINEVFANQTYTSGKAEYKAGNPQIPFSIIIKLEKGITTSDLIYFSRRSPATNETSYQQPFYLEIEGLWNETIRGQKGSDGYNGTDGAQGPRGPRGPKGDRGDGILKPIVHELVNHNGTYLPGTSDSFLSAGQWTDYDEIKYLVTLKTPSSLFTFHTLKGSFLKEMISPDRQGTIIWDRVTFSSSDAVSGEVIFEILDNNDGKAEVYIYSNPFNSESILWIVKIYGIKY